MNRKIMPLILMLVAGAVTCVITFIEKYSMYERLLALLIVLLVFYFLGCALKWALDYFDRQNKAEESENEEGEEETGNGEEGEVIEKDTEVESEEQQKSASEE